MGIDQVVSFQYRQIVDSAAEAARGITVPREGWIATARKALGMSGAQLARRLGVSRAQVSQTEKNEVSGSVTLKTVQKMAEAMGYRFVYTIVPVTTVTGVIEARAREKATAIVNTTSTHMALEGQALSTAQIEYEKNRIQQDLVNEPPATFWNDE